MANKILDLTKPVQTRDGKPARIICTDRLTNPTTTVAPHPLVALVLEDEGREVVYCFTAKGEFWTMLPGESPMDLINVPEKHIRYVVLWRAKNEALRTGPSNCYITDKKVEPKNWPGTEIVAIKEVEIEEGEGL